jgi:glycogen operon protein
MSRNQQDMNLEAGKSFPLGATSYPTGVNFSVFSKNCTTMELLLFDHADDGQPSRVIPLHPKRNRTFYYWHVFVPGLKPGQLYGYRAHGPFEPHKGFRFDGQKLLLDPYGRGVVRGQNYSYHAAAIPGDNTAHAMKSVVADPAGYDWEGDTPLRQPFSHTVIYEMHVAGFTRHPNSGISAEKRGTYAGLIEKIPYLKNLGITAVELLPVFQFEEQEAPPGLTNYWGYNPVSFFAPHCGYSSRKDPLGPLDEFRAMVKALHRAGIEVILDVVYNHTAEGDHTGPTFCFRGLENRAYYILEEDNQFYANYSGTGNTLNANQSIVRRMIVDSLHYWVEEMHVDGFRFDLASILSRGEAGRPLESPPIIWEIESDPILAGTKLIAEAWDAAGLYQVGSFTGDRWKEWNGRFRDDARSFVKGDVGSAAKLPARLLASPDIYGHEEREPEQSINFVTAHDGFTLNDLVSYNQKHNEANNEDNRDGNDNNLSWNCGVEGPSDDPEIEQLRRRQIKNFLTLNMLSLGVPMMLMGDEVRRSQQGNNNAYCQDNELSWFDWTLPDKHSDLLRFARRLIRLRLTAGVFRQIRGLTLTQLLKQAEIQWHGVKLNQADFGYRSHSLACTVTARYAIFHVILNAYWEPLSFELPPLPHGARGGWQRLIDTYLPSPEDFCDPGRMPSIAGQAYTAQARSVVVLVAERHT